MLRKIGQENGQIETDFFGRVVEAFREFNVVNFAIVICVTASEHKINLFPDPTDINC